MHTNWVLFLQNQDTLFRFWKKSRGKVYRKARKLEDELLDEQEQATDRSKHRETQPQLNYKELKIKMK